MPSRYRPTSIYSVSHLLIGRSVSKRIIIVLNIYPCIFTLVAGAQGILALARLFQSWSQVVRDEAFLVEMRLQNLDIGQEGRLETDLEEENQGVDDE